MDERTGKIRKFLIFKKPVKKPLAIIFVERMVFFLSIMILLTMGLYIRGNFNDFTDATQRLLLHIAGITGICLVFSGAIGVILDLFMILHLKLTYTGSIVLYIIAGSIGATSTAAALFIQTLTVG
ncbi:MAG: hypothetical protein LBG05_07510 [Treponema sp.]|jgi:hypothetical protein|nr:hypothetical protein [Treponema sp.]